MNCLSAKAFQRAANVRAVGRAIFINDFAEDEYFAGAEDVRGPPIKSAPIHGQAQIAFALRGESANRGAVEREVVPALYEKFLVVIEHVQTAFQVAEEHGDGFDALLVGEVLDALFLNLVRRKAILALFLGFQVELFEFIVRDC